ncbi:MAG: hypothetical protein JXR94_09405, partial [Candidatus Hydrogenedentes bacterium]|nr:hypothetical protein [Candidatus Hydrogenedentota bacterium]
FAVVQAGAAVLSAMPEPRYIMAVAVVLSLWAARGLGIVGEQAAGVPRHRWLRRVPVGAMAGLMLLGLAMNVAPEYTGRPARMPREYRAAGRWMKENLEPGLVFSRKPQVGFYADMPTTGPGADETVDEALARARAAGARYVVVDERYTTTMLPAWQPLLDPANAPASLRLLEADLSPYATARIVIYEFRGLRAGGARDL